MITNASQETAPAFKRTKYKNRNIIACLLLGNSPASENFICQSFGTLCLFRLHRRIGVKNDWVENLEVFTRNGKRFGSKIDRANGSGYYKRRWNRQSVPKLRHIKFRRRGITQKKAYSIQNTAKV